MKRDFVVTCSPCIVYKQVYFLTRLSEKEIYFVPFHKPPFKGVFKDRPLEVVIVTILIVLVGGINNLSGSDGTAKCKLVTILFKLKRKKYTYI